MIRYTLKCSEEHRFDSWFASSTAFDDLAASGHLTCAVCGSTSVTKELMAPPVPRKGTALEAPASKEEAALAEMRKTVETNSDYVGKDFATEARAIHDGVSPERSIYGEADLKSAKALVDDGIPIVPLPFVPARKTN